MSSDGYGLLETSLQNRHLGYARVSTYGQTLDAQLQQFRAEAPARARAFVLSMTHGPTPRPRTGA